jgi:hypothetical protein
MELKGPAKFLFFTMMNAAIKMKEMGLTEEDFISFSRGIWETLEMNDADKLYETLQSAMKNDLEEFTGEKWDSIKGKINGKRN